MPSSSPSINVSPANARGDQPLASRLVPLSVQVSSLEDPEAGAQAVGRTPRRAPPASPAPDHGDAAPSGKHRRRISDFFFFHRRRQRQEQSCKASRHDGARQYDNGAAAYHHYIPQQERRRHHSRGCSCATSSSGAAAAALAATNSNTANPDPSLPRISAAEQEQTNKDDLEAFWKTKSMTLVQPALSPSQSLSTRSLISAAGGDHTRSFSSFASSGNRSNALSIDDAYSSKIRSNEVTIERAIQLHEANDIVRSTRMFQVLADPHGANNAIAQVFYGIARRHGWGCSMNTHEAFHFLLTGASTAAVVLEKEAATAKAHADIIGKYSGATGSAAGNGNGTGKARKTLGMAMYELANCYRNAWGTPRDPPAARRFYTLSANLGDTDAMCEAAWCYERPFGGKKDKYTAAQYYRLAMKNGVQMTGMSWIDKPKYRPRD